MSEIEKDKIKQELLNKKNKRQTEADERQKRVFDARRAEIDREAYRKRIPIEGSQTEADRERRQTEADNRERILREIASKIDIMSKIVLNINIVI
jgi:hypothetical protein